MAVITTGGGTGLTINATGNSANVKLTDSGGNELGKPSSTGNAYLVNFNVRQTATTAGGSTGLVWHMRNGTGGSVNCRVRAIRGNVTFDGTGAATDARYGLWRTNTAAPTGGSTVVVSKKNTGMGPTLVTDIRFVDTGLTIGSLARETDAFYVASCARGATGFNAPFSLIFSTLEVASAFILLPGEGLGIYLINTAVIGDGISGSVEWDESTTP